MDDVLLRPMRPADVPVAERLSSEAFYDLDLRLHRPGLPDPRPRPATRAHGWLRRTEHLLLTDPGGSWVAEDGSGMLGFATSFVRETTWFLATYAVRPGLQGRGIGKPLLEAAMHSGRGALHGMLSATDDPKAVRRYRLAGFDLHPQMLLRGTVDRSAIPPLDKIREGTPGDVDLMDSVDRHARGAGRGGDHGLMMDSWQLLVSDSTTGSGYVYVADGPEAGPVLLAATNRRTAARLLWAAIALASEQGGEVLVPHVTGANQWAIEVGMAARLELHTQGYLALRGMKPPTPYLHHGAFL